MVSSGTVGVSGPIGYKRQLSIRELVRAEKPHLGKGLYLRSLNLILALLLSLGGLFIVNANPPVERTRMRSAKLGMFIPVVFAAVALWFALIGRRRRNRLPWSLGLSRRGGSFLLG